MNLLFYFGMMQVLFSEPKEPKFEGQTIDDQVSIGYGLAIGDVDGDGKPDILMADKKQFVWYRNGDWKRFVMVENLTESDNVCLAARDIDGDGKVEVAVGAQWNPGETSDPLKSGSVHYLIRPEDPTQKWTPIPLHHEPTVHRMKWAQMGKNEYQLIVLPLHGRGNANGQGAGVKVLAYSMPKDPRNEWTYQVIDESMHLTHNLELISDKKGNGETLLVGGKEGVKAFSFVDKRWKPKEKQEWLVTSQSFGEIRFAGHNSSTGLLAGIQPMHGNQLSLYQLNQGAMNSSMETPKILDEDLKEGHALAIADLMGIGTPQIIAGWRVKNQEENVGIKIYIPENDSNSKFKSYWIDQDGMACEDLQVADLNGDGKLDIIAAGRASKNLKIYWNRTN